MTLLTKPAPTGLPTTPFSVYASITAFDGLTEKGSLLFREDKEWLQRLDEVIDTNLDKSDFTVLQLATAMYVSERQLRRRIKQLLGVRPQAYLTQVRMKRARRLLLNAPHRPVEWVAREVGFSSACTFMRAFKRHSGQLPD